MAAIQENNDNNIAQYMSTTSILCGLFVKYIDIKINTNATTYPTK